MMQNSIPGLVPYAALLMDPGPVATLGCHLRERKVEICEGPAERFRAHMQLLGEHRVRLERMKSNGLDSKGSR